LPSSEIIFGRLSQARNTEAAAFACGFGAQADVGLPAGAVRTSGSPKQHWLVGSRSDPTLAEAGVYVVRGCDERSTYAE
jgi:hypothetical protein